MQISGKNGLNIRKNTSATNSILKKKPTKLCYIVYSNSPSVIYQSNLSPSRDSLVDYAREITRQYNTVCYFLFLFYLF